MINNRPISKSKLKDYKWRPRFYRIVRNIFRQSKRR